MLKLAPNTACFALALSLLLPLAQGVADAKPSNSFKSGFSSQRSSSSSSPRNAGAASRGGGFGSFGGGAAPDARKSDSALSRKLDREASEARALRTLDERRAAQAARNTPPPPPVYDQAPRNQPYNAPPYGYGQAQPPVNVRRDSNLGPIIAGAVIANMAANAHVHRGNGQAQTQQQQPAPLPAPTWNGGVDSINGAGGVGSVNGQALPAGSAPHSRGGSVFGAIATLAVLALIVWGVVTLVRRRKRKASQQHYSFERN